ncbi:hypothetical protein PQC13_gp206 [Synechococcus phage S-SRM01]|uniref:DUF6321 domain-containing protein n=1 Tax=Synechococcus phage S-SRM01 TaxID=2781608 RepID=A0A879R2F4_9CAUD|nr:hypothetical protein PQC13_gp206 [Synechococcus phage S-SRM01]QPX48171.1 hypothetical protein [Synechococcus phage S-SRM01]
MGWSEKYKKSIDCNNPKGFSQRAHCQGRNKKLKEQFKPFKTVEEIAKKHRMDVSFIQKQLDMGEPIEHEHTKNHELAKEIALQHLDEIPDYYTRLKKMEASAKKEHKKFKDVKINEEGLRAWFGKSKSKEGKPGWVNVVTGGTCASDEPGEGTPKCVSSAKRASMTKAERLSAARRKKAADPGQQEKSGAAKPTYVTTDPKKKMKEELDLQEVTDKPGKGSGKKDACYHKVKSRYDVWPSAYASGALVKCRKVGAANWGTKSEAMEMVRYCPKCQKDETRNECKYGVKYWDMFSRPSALTTNQLKYNIATVHPGNFPESYDHEYSMARSELSTIIAAAKRLRKKMKGEGNIEAWVQSKITKAADYIDAAADYIDSGEMSEQVANTDTMSDKKPFDIAVKKIMDRKGKLTPSQRIIALKQAGKLQGVDESAAALLRAGLAAGTALAGMSVVKQAKEVGKKIEARNQQTQKAIDSLRNSYDLEGEVIDEKCWDGYKKKGMKTMFGKRYPNCVKAEGFSNWREEMGLSEDWQSVNRKDKTDGLSQKAVNAYRRENPGSKLQTAVTEKKPTGKRAKRRASFCRRSAGQRDMHNIDCSKTPDKPICKARKRWNC